MDVGVSVSGAMSGEDFVDNNALYTGSVSYGINDWLALGAEAGWWDSSFHDDDLTAVPIFADIILRVPNPSMVEPYGILGLGSVIWNVDDTAGNSLQDDVNASFAAKLGGGVDVFLNNNWAVFGEVAYVFSNDDLQRVSDPDQTDLDYWTAGGGLKFVF